MRPSTMSSGTPALGYRLIEWIREVTGQPIERVVVSHYHADYIYGLQAFVEHADGPPVCAQLATLGYVGGSAATQGKGAEGRLTQRRQALSPWIDEDTYFITPDKTSAKTLEFEVAAWPSRFVISDRHMLQETASCWSGTSVCFSAVA